MDKQVTITLFMEQVCNDILVNCNAISKQMGDDADADIRADIQSPDADETRSIVCRAVTEAIGNIKHAGARYMMFGRNDDDDRLERLAYEDASTGKVAYEKAVLEMKIPNFNLSSTDALKSHMHKYVVDYAMARFLHDHHDEKHTQYAADASAEYESVKEVFRSRDRFVNRTSSWCG